MGSTRQTFSQDRHAGHLPATDPSDYNLTTNSIWPVGIRIKQTEDIWTIWNPPNCYNNTKRKHRIRWKTGKIFFCDTSWSSLRQKLLFCCCLSVKLFFFHVLKSPGPLSITYSRVIEVSVRKLPQKSNNST